MICCPAFLSQVLCVRVLKPELENGAVDPSGGGPSEMACVSLAEIGDNLVVSLLFIHHQTPTASRLDPLLDADTHTSRWIVFDSSSCIPPTGCPSKTRFHHCSAPATQHVTQGFVLYFK